MILSGGGKRSLCLTFDSWRDISHLKHKFGKIPKLFRPFQDALDIVGGLTIEKTPEYVLLKHVAGYSYGLGYDDLLKSIQDGIDAGNDVHITWGRLYSRGQLLVLPSTLQESVRLCAFKVKLESKTLGHGM